MDSPYLKKVSESVALAVSIKLKSNSAIIKHAMPAIAEAMDVGHSNKDILDVIYKAGLKMSSDGLLVYLYRYRRQFKEMQTQATNSEQLIDNSLFSKSNEHDDVSSSATAFSDTLKSSVSIANKDYSKFSKQIKKP